MSVVERILRLALNLQASDFLDCGVERQLQPIATLVDFLLRRRRSHERRYSSEVFDCHVDCGHKLKRDHLVEVHPLRLCWVKVLAHSARWPANPESPSYEESPDPRSVTTFGEGFLGCDDLW
jgi:hypothetical protein